jgi:hypothetical protein
MTTQAQEVTFGEWLPDLPARGNPGTLVAKNAIPQEQSYRSINALSEFTNALDGPCLGSFWVQDDNNVVNNFAGDETKLYTLSGGNVWGDATRTVGGAYTATSWEFAKFGNRVIAVNGADEPQKFDLGVDTEFSDLAGTPPKTPHIAVVRDFVVFGDVDTQGPSFLRWSGFNNSETWTPSLATQADYQQIFGRGGKIQRIVPGEYGLILLEHSIYRMDYAGPPLIFQLDEIERNRGTPAPYSVMWSGGLTWYYGWDGFYVFDGQQSIPISSNRVAEWFKDEVDPESLADIRGAIDRRNRLVIWAFRTSKSLDYNNRLIIYNWAAGENGRWSYAELDTEVMEEFVSSGYALDELDTPLPLGIDLDSINVDSDQFAGGRLSLQAFTPTHTSATFDGTPLTACLDTKEVGVPDNARMFVNSVRPLVEAANSATTTVQVGTRDNLNDNVTFSIARALNDINGEANVRASSRYQRYRLNIAGGFNHAVGVKAQIKGGGGRR